MIYVRFESNKAKLHCVVLAFLFIIIIVLGGGFAVFYLAYHQGQSIGIASLRSLKFPLESLTPPKSYLNSKLILPASGSPSNSTWISSILYLLTAQYKMQAVDMRNINPDFYLALSQTQFQKVSEIIYSQNKSIYSLGQKINFNEIHPIAFCSMANSQPLFNHIVFPESQCEPARECQISEDLFEENPLEFVTAPYSYSRGITQIKKLFYAAGRPLVFLFSTPIIKIKIPCTEYFANESYICKTGISEHYFYSFSNDDLTDTQISFMDKQPITTNGEEFYTIIGYNDNFQFPTIQGEPSMKGGFIVRPSHKIKGHTYEYLLGAITQIEEDYHCPNIMDEYRWIPASLSCVESQQSIRNCSTDRQIIYGKNVVSGAFELKCINESVCDINSSYALLENNTFPQYPYFEYNQKSKFYQTKLIKIDENSNISIIKPFIPFSHLHNYFVPNFEEFATIEDGDSPSRCGFTIIPYKVVQDIDGIANTDIGAYHIPFSWHSTSFNRTSDSSTYRYVVNSTSYYPVYLQKPNLPDLEL